MFVYSRHECRVHNVWHIIYDQLFHVCLFQTKTTCPNVRHIINGQRSLSVWLPDKNTMSVMFDISSMIILLHVCVFQSSILCPYCLTCHLLLQLFMFASSRDKYRVLNVWHKIIDYHCSCLCLPELLTMSGLFDISSMIFLLYVSVFQSSIVFPYC